ncbi:MAG: peptidase [Mycolicibacterium sp.]|uniref:peptidase n=1 Tax=Mycolicibacterium sp. TaxID=2320850 RepID=UPI003D11144D
MRRSSTFGATETARAVGRRRLGAVLGAELLCAVLLVAGPQVGPPVPAVAGAPAGAVADAAGSAARDVALPDSRTARLIDLGAPGGSVLLDRIAAELPGAAGAVTAFWGPRWRRDVLIVVAGSAHQFATVGGGGIGIAATTSPDRITFAPGAVAMNSADLRTVLRHELFHYAARPDTAVDAPTWLTEGVADFVGRAEDAESVTWAPAASSGRLPTDAELSTPGPGRSLAYDRAWSFVSYVADRYGIDGLRALYLQAGGIGRTDVVTAVRNALGVELPVVLAGWTHWHGASSTR